MNSSTDNPESTTLEETIGQLSTLLDGLKAFGITRKVIAERAQVTPSYVSQFAPKRGAATSKVPSHEVVVKLAIACHDLLRDRHVDPAGLSEPVKTALLVLSERYVPTGTFAASSYEPGQPLPYPHSNYVARELDRLFEGILPMPGRLNQPGAWMLSGTHASGKRSLMTKFLHKFF